MHGLYLNFFIINHYSELIDLSKNDKSKQLLCIAAVKEWGELKDDILISLAESMKRRLEAVVTANGWYTKH